MINKAKNRSPFLITICVLIYENIEQLDNTLKNITSQTYQELELIVSDDCSKNIPLCTIEDILKPYESRFKNVIINKNSKNVGTVQHINNLLPMVHGSILCTMGADDRFYDNNVIKDVAEYFEKNPDRLVLTSKRFDESDSKVRPCPKAQYILQHQFYKYRKLMFRAEPIISGIGTFYHMDIFKKYPHFPNEFKLLEDAPFYTLLISEGIDFGFLDRITYIHDGGGVSDSSALPHPWFVADNKYLYSHWMKSLSENQDYFTKRCTNYRSKRIHVNTTIDLVKLYIKYFDVSVYLFWIYKIMHWE